VDLKYVHALSLTASHPEKTTDNSWLSVFLGRHVMAVSN